MPLLLHPELFAAGVTDGFLGANPAAGARAPRVDRVPIVPPTVEEIQALQAAAPGWFAIAVTLGARARLRQGEAAGLTEDRVAFLRRQLTVDRQLLPLPSVKGEPIELGLPKTDRYYRTVPTGRSWATRSPRACGVRDRRPWSDPATADSLGHSPAVLQSTFAHLIPADHDRARGAVEAAFKTVTEDGGENLLGTS